MAGFTPLRIVWRRGVDFRDEARIVGMALCTIRAVMMPQIPLHRVIIQWRTTVVPVMVCQGMTGFATIFIKRWSIGERTRPGKRCQDDSARDNTAQDRRADRFDIRLLEHGVVTIYARKTIRVLWRPIDHNPINVTVGEDIRCGREAAFQCA